MGKRGPKPNGYTDQYLCYQNCGINIVQFYHDMGTNISRVSKATGISRQALTRFMANHTVDDTNNKIILHLEEFVIKDYQNTIQQIGKEYEELRQKVDDTWNLYLKREALLDEYRSKYYVERKHPMQTKITQKDVFEKNA